MMLLLKRISPRLIVKGHFASFVRLSNGKEKFQWLEVLAVVSIPILLSAFIIYHKGPISSELNSNVVTGFSVLAGLLANTTVLLVTRYDNSPQSSVSEETQVLVKETFFHSAYGLFLCLCCVFFSMTYELVKTTYYELWNFKIELGEIWSAIVLTLVFSFIHTALLVMKRFTSVFSK